MKELITIGISAYNAEATIKAAIISAISQSWQNIEIVIVDDCSTDNTIKIIEEVSQNVSNIKILKHASNLGVAAARNTIINNSNGEFIAFFDDDDQSHFKRVEVQRNEIKALESKLGHNIRVLCHTSRIIIKNNHKFEYVLSMGSPLIHKIPYGVNVAKKILLGYPLLHGQGSCATCSQMARTTTYNSLGGFDIKLRRSEDTDLNIRHALNGGYFLGISTPFVIQNINISTHKSKNIDNMYFLRTLEKYKEFIEQHSNFNFVYQWYLMRFCLQERDFYKAFSHLLVMVFTYPFEFARRSVFFVLSIALVYFQLIICRMR